VSNKGEKIELVLVGLTYSQSQSGSYAMVLAEKNGKRRIPIIIGNPEAQAIAVEIEGMTPNRPLTHDLFVNFAKSFRIEVKEVLIYNLLEGVFHASIVCTDGIRDEVIDSRTSDAIALSLRFKCPIYTYEFILASAGIVVEDTEVESTETESEFYGSSPEKESGNLSSMSLGELKEELNRALHEEAYERASEIRDEIQRRKEQSS
jgi:uncharacterized protein